MVINSGLLCLLSGTNHYKSFGGTWRRLVSLRDEIIRDSNLGEPRTKLVLFYISVIERDF